MHESFAVARPLPVHALRIDLGHAERSVEVPFRAGMTLRDFMPREVHHQHVLWGRGPSYADVVPEGLGADVLDSPVHPGDHLVLVVRPLGGVDDAFKSLINFTKKVYSLVLGGISHYTLGKLKDYLVPDLPGRPVGVDNSQVYAWSGIGANYVPAGTPIPKFYGELRIGLSIVAQDIEIRETADGPQSFLRMIGVVAEGRIDSIGQYDADVDAIDNPDLLPNGMQIDGNDASNFDDVRCWVRLGDFDQNYIDGFETLRTVYDVGLDLDQGDGSASDPVLDDFEYAEVYDMAQGDEADRATITFGFPGGLYRVKDSGGLGTQEATFQVRTTRLDNDGLPVGDSVVHPSPFSSFSVKKKINSAFGHQVSIPLYDPASFVAPSFGAAIDFNAGADYAYIPQTIMAAGAIPGFVAGAQPDAFTLFMVVQPDLLSATPRPLFSWGDWNEDSVSPEVEGLVISTQRQGSEDVNEVVVWYGNSTSAGTRVVVGGEIINGDAASIAVTYSKTGGVFGEPRLDLYVDGALVGTSISSTPIEWGAFGGFGPTINTTSRKAGGSSSFHNGALYDEITLYSVAKTASQVSALHASGAWQTRAGDDDVVLGLTMDQAVFFTPDWFTTVDYGALADVIPGAAMIIEGFTPSPVTGPVADAPAQNATLRGRYRFEVQRTNADTNSASKQDDASFDSIILELDDRVRYSGLALVGLEVLATGQLNSSRPNVTVQARGLLVDVWDGVDPVNPSFVRTYTTTPAWQVADLLVSDEGLGRYFSLDSLRLLDFLDWAQFTEERVYDQRGRLPITRLEYVDNGDGSFSTLARVPRPIPAHWVVGGSAKARNVVPGAYPFKSELFVVEDIVEVDDDYVDVQYEAAEVFNANPFPNDFSSWGTTGTAPTIDATNSTDHVPPFTQNNVAEEVTWGPALSMFSTSIAGLSVGATYALSVYVKVIDGGGAFSIRLDLGTSTEIISVPDDGNFHRVSAFIAANNPTLSMRIGNASAGQDGRQTALAGAMIHFGTVLLPFDEAPSGVLSPTNILVATNATNDSDIWEPGVAGASTNPPVLTEVDAEAIPGIPGKAELWTVEESNTHIFQTPDSGGWTPLTTSADYVISCYAKVADGRGLMQGKMVIGGAQQSDKWALPDDGEWHRIIYQGAAASSSGTAGNGIRFTNILGQRRILIGGFHLSPGTVSVGYDSGDQLGELFFTEARIETAFFFGDRNLGAWDAVLMMMRAARAAPSRLGEVLGVRVDRPRDPVFVFTPANMKAGSITRGIAGHTRPNSLTAEFQSNQLDFERDSITRDHPSLEAADASSTTGLRSRVIDMRGLTSPSVVTRELDQRLLSGFGRRESIGWESEVDAFHLRPGQVVAVAAPTKRWARGAKVYQDGVDETDLRTDQPFVIGAKNLLEWSNDLTADAWNRTAQSGDADEPTVTANYSDEPSEFGGHATASLVSFPGTGTNSRVRQGVRARGVGTTYTMVLWVRLRSGAADTTQLSIVTAAETVAQLTPTLTGSYQRLVLSGEQSMAADEVFFRIKQDDADAALLEIDVARVRGFVGDDDGLDAVGMEATRSFPQLYVTLKSGATDAVSVVKCLNRSGEFAVGDAIEVDGAFEFVPAAGDVFAIGPTRTTLYELLGQRTDFRGATSFEAVTYIDDFRDPDDYETIDLPTVIGVAGQQSQAALVASSPSALPPQPKAINVYEESERDPATGNAVSALMVGWSFPSREGGSLDRVLIWARIAGSDDEFENVDTVAAPKNLARISASRFSFQRGDRVEVKVQPVTRTGLRRSLKRAVGKVVVVGGYFPVPPAPSGARVVMVGTKAVYEVDDPSAGWQSSVADIVRGGVFVNSPVGRLPTGGGAFGPTDDWCQLPTSADGRGNPRLLVRTNGPDGARGAFVEVTDELDLEGWPDVLAEGSWEDGPWSTAGALDAELEEVDPDPAWLGGWKELRFKDASSSVQGIWTGDIVDLGRARRVHVSAGFIGEQVHPLVFEEFPPFEMPRGGRWTFEGPLDRADPLHDEVAVRLEVAYSKTAADPGSSYRRFKPGVFYARSLRFRIVIERPDATWNLRVSRGAFAVRPLPPSDADDIDAGRITG